MRGRFGSPRRSRWRDRALGDAYSFSNSRFKL